ncbi:hypothetical protein RUMOBE_02593 [Blautia obeum ATCC 29174]|uniref:Uncharacterized protein n=1 Tax=Blautia obeum ATCC 29174 TaxID=411459 RepID=A5ZUA9_9FIRM|nr:hypothetical protein RUMOBE_02593 [Blautia obeum ATCC 29174]
MQVSLDFCFGDFIICVMLKKKYTGGYYNDQT